MSKSSVFNTPKVVIPTLAIAVIGMAAMIGVTSNMQRNFDTTSEASEGSCLTISHKLDKTYVNRHFSKSGNGDYSAQRDRDFLTLSQPKSSSESSTVLAYDQKAKGDFKNEITVRSVDLGGNKGQAVFGFNAGENGFYVGLIGNKDGTFQAYAQNRLNGTWGQQTLSAAKKMKFPVNLRVERSDANVTYSFKETGSERVVLRSNDSVTEDNAKVEVFVTSLAPEFPKVSAVFSDFYLRCK